MENDLPPPDAEITDPRNEYGNINISSEFHSQPSAMDNVVKEESEDSMTDSYSSGGAPEPSQLSIDQRLDRLEKMTCTVFDAIRQISQQVYSVDTKLADILTNGMLLKNSVCLTQQSATDLETNNVFDSNGVDLEVPNANITSIHNDGSRRLSWNERLEELKRYRESNGHCAVPQIYDSGLGTWVSAQRSQHKRFTMGKTTSMTKQRKEALEKLGFSWSLRKRYSWDERFAELRAFSEDNQGSCEVPNEGIYKPLWIWCLNQRHGYKNGLEGKGPLVPPERVEMMERLGFRWVTDPPDDSNYFTSNADSDSQIPTNEIQNITSENEMFMSRLSDAQKITFSGGWGRQIRTQKRKSL